MNGAPNPNLGLGILRVVIGVIYVSHGAPKLFAGDFGIGVGQLAEMLGGLGVPLSGVLAWVVALLEFFGGLSLIVGFLVTPVALLFVVHMLVGIILVHAPEGWFVIGPGQGGAEFNTLLIAGLATLVLAGPGAAAVDSRRALASPGYEARSPEDVPESPAGGADETPRVG